MILGYDISINCAYCGFKISSEYNIKKIFDEHLRYYHRTNAVEYVKKFIYKNGHPHCKCGCHKKTDFDEKSLRYREYVNGHKRLTVPIRKPCKKINVNILLFFFNKVHEQNKLLCHKKFKKKFKCPLKCNFKTNFLHEVSEHLSLFHKMSLVEIVKSKFRRGKPRCRLCGRNTFFSYEAFSYSLYCSKFHKKEIMEIANVNFSNGRSWIYRKQFSR